MTTRRDFIKSTIATTISSGCVIGASGRQTICIPKTFEDKLRNEVEDAMKKHLYEHNNESTHRAIEAEIDDWVHMYVMPGEVDMFRVQCGMSNSLSDVKCWVKCIFKKHNDEKVKVLTCEVREESV